MRDVTVWLHLQKERNKTEILKNIQSTVSHNVRAPISATSALSELLKKKLVNCSPEIKEIVNAIYSASNLSHFFIQDLLDY